LAFFAQGKTMTSDHLTGIDPETNFSFGVHELRQANAALKLSVDTAPPKAANEHRGVDPYNTSGSFSFDRSKSLVRVRRR
jgi:hypothetical protein